VEELAPYFAKHPAKKEKPTNDDVERDVRSLLHGTREGRVVVENIKPHTVPGVHRVIDDVGSGHTRNGETETE
jgi:hypothetical protein